MIELNSCPVCEGNDLVTLLSTLSKFDDSFRSRITAEINHLLRNIMCIDELVVHTKMCRKCKHIFLSPTFSFQETALMYSEEGSCKKKLFYQRVRNDSGLSSREALLSKALAQNYMDCLGYRGLFMYDVVNAYGKRSTGKILDIGGGSGCNILPFKDSNKFVYDLFKDSGMSKEVSFISDFKIAQSLAPFDLLVSTHTLEHIVNLKETVDLYVSLVKPGGLFYVEVPLEYLQVLIKSRLYNIFKKGNHIQYHIQYFSPASLKYLIENSGFKALYFEKHPMPYNSILQYVIIGLFEYTGIAQAKCSSNTSWFCEFLSDLFKFTGSQAYYKLSGRFLLPKRFFN